MTRSAFRVVALALVALLSSCATRSISNPTRPSAGGNSSYSGELSDFDVVGTAVDGSAEPGDVVLRPRARVLVVQSGAAFPDERMLNGLAERFDVGAASGLPTPALHEHGMRDAAARGGFDAIVAYWGVLETSESATAAAAASWVPVAGVFVPDRNQRMRIRLRIVILDVRTGRWRTLLPEPIDDERASSMLTRESHDRDQVELLMGAAMLAAIGAITREP